MAKRPVGELYGLPQAIEVYEDLPYGQRRELLGSNIVLFEEAFLLNERHDDDECWSDAPLTRKRASRKDRKEWTPQFLAAVSPRRVQEVCLKAAQDDLAKYFKRLCEDWTVSFLTHDDTSYVVRLQGAPWYFANVGNALLDFIDSRREALRGRIAETEITRSVFRWMTKSLHTKRAVMISGNSRFGKTEAVKLYAQMHPGDSRLVNTPATGALGDLVREVAKSLGMEVGPQNGGRDLRERVDYVLRFSRLLLCFDESQFLLPAVFTRNTAPARLNWIRRSVMDQDVPAVFVYTPQSYLPAKKRFLKATGFAMEQFDERPLNTVHLPEELSESDLLAVARIHFADLSDEYLQYVVAKALATERNYVSDIEKIATLAKDNAREHGRERPFLCDIEAAIVDVLPALPARSAPPPPVAKPKPPIAAPLPRPCRTSADASQPPRKGLETLSRDRFARPAEVPV
jgi:hypothetical protein